MFFLFKWLTWQKTLYTVHTTLQTSLHPGARTVFVSSSRRSVGAATAPWCAGGCRSSWQTGQTSAGCLLVLCLRLTKSLALSLAVACASPPHTPLPYLPYH